MKLWRLFSLPVLLLPTAAEGVFEDLGLQPFLSYTASGQAMGNAVASLPGHPSNIWTNPAGTAFQEGLLLYVSPHDEVNDVQDNKRDRVFAASYLVSDGNAVGAALILRQTDDGSFLFSPGTFFVTDVLEKSLMLSYARKFGEHWGAGLTFLGYEQTSDDERLDSEKTMAVTLGILNRTGFLFKGEFPIETRVGFSVANLGRTFSLGTLEADLPLYARIGYSVHWEKDHRNSLTASGDIYSLLRDKSQPGGSEKDDSAFNNLTDRLGWGVGVEARVSGVVAIRFGYLSDDDITQDGRSGGTFGFGVGHEIYRGIGGMVEYARSPAEFDTADHIGVRIYLVPDSFGIE